MIALLRPQADARSVRQPEPAALGLLRWDLQPLASPDTLDPLVVDYPARLAQQLGDLAIAVAAVLLGKLDNIGRQTLLVLTAARGLALRRAMLSERRAGATLGDMQLRSHLLNAGTATRDHFNGGSLTRPQDALVTPRLIINATSTNGMAIKDNRALSYPYFPLVTR